VPVDQRSLQDVMRFDLPLPQRNDELRFHPAFCPNEMCNLHDP
jgi:hypothetical protein